MPKPSQLKKSNFDDSFLYDFGLMGIKRDHYSGTDVHRKYIWEYSKKALDRFHLPITYRNQNGPESDVHYKFKQKIHDYIYEQYYLSEGCKFYVTTELEQIMNPFPYVFDSEEKIFYTLDVCAIREKDNQIFDFEIDKGKEHYTKMGIMRAEIRDRLLKDRYGVFTMRIDPNEYSDINPKKIDEFISQPACKNPYYDIHNKRLVNSPVKKKKNN